MTRLAMLVEEGFQDEEVLEPSAIAQFLGWEVEVLGSGKITYTGKHGITVHATKSLHPLEAPVAADYDAVLIPGGWQCPERLRRDQTVLQFVCEMHAAGKVVAAICHGPWVLASAGLCYDTKVYPLGEGPKSGSYARRMTCYLGMKDDLINAGAEWVDQPVVTDGNVVTAQHYRDIPAFMRAIAELLK